MRRAFTLIELLVVLGMIAALTGMAVLSVFGGRDAAKMRGTVRDVFATVRLARSMALVTQKPAIVTFSTKVSGDSCRSSATITSAELMSTRKGTVRARSVGGEWITVGEGAAEEERGSRAAFVVSNRDDGNAGAAAQTPSEGESVEEILFSPAAEELFEDVAIKIVMDDEEMPDSSGAAGVSEAKKSMVSTFSNVDFLLGVYKEERARKKAEAEAKAAEEARAEASSVKSPDVEEEEKSLAWQVNGRCDPHRIFIYTRGREYDSGWKIRVDRFGGAKIYAPGEDEEER